jgi:hypothetical protein
MFMLDTDLTHTHTHIYVYMYIYIYIQQIPAAYPAEFVLALFACDVVAALCVCACACVWGGDEE